MRFTSGDATAGDLVNEVTKQKQAKGKIQQE